MLITGIVCFLLICVLAYVAGVFLIFIPLALIKTASGGMREILGGQPDLDASSQAASSASPERSERPKSTLKTYDPAVLEQIYVPVGAAYAADADYYKLLAEKIYMENNMKMPDLSGLIIPDDPTSKEPPKHLIDTYITRRVIDSEYPTDSLDLSAATKYIEYKSRESAPIQYDDVVDLMCRCIITLNIRDLTKQESTEAKRAVELFVEGKITEPTKTIHTRSGSYTIDTCYKKKLESPTQKALHWGQRKLLLSEIDFINRAAYDMGVDVFKSNPITILYPGAAHGDHLMILMELYPNIRLYLWDPAKYNPVLYLADFMRRNLPLPRHADFEKTMALKYANRVFINMELSNRDYLQYYDNATNRRIPDNYETQHGFFLPGSIEYFRKHREETNDTSKILFVSDIRLYTNIEINNFISANKTKAFTNPVIKYFYDRLSLKDYSRDMDLQKTWFLDSGSDYGLFKFKLALPNTFAHKKYAEYLDGDVIIQTWGGEKTTETRLFVKPKRQPTAYYNIEKYMGSMHFVNKRIRTYDLSRHRLRDLGIGLDSTMADIWSDFLPRTKIGSDALLETYILYDYLKLHKSRIGETDLMLLISDITQTLINKTDQTGILSYLRDTPPKHVQQKKFSLRKKYHAKFNTRLDFTSARHDNLLCDIV
jgi:hypothetical protein